MAKAKEIVGLDCGAEAGEMIRAVLTTRLAEMIECREAALGVDGGDGVDGVHDMRVASRRLRSALRDFVPHLSKKKLEDALGEVKSVADALGRVRDRDVAVFELEKVSAEAPEEMRSGVEEFARARRSEREGARAKLAREISEERLAELRATFEGALEQALRAARRGKKDADARPPVSFRDAGREIILARWEELRERCASLHNPFRTKRLHKTRISAKRLRYALELFTPCWGERLKEFGKETAGLQGSLGDLHDADVWIELMGAWLSERAGKAAGASAETEGAAGRQEDAAVWLLSHFVSERTKNYRDALARWHEWERGGFGERLRAALSAEVGVEESAAPAESPSTEESGASARESDGADVTQSLNPSPS